MSAKLECLDKRVIAIDFDVNGSMVPLTGTGMLYQDPSMGECLKICIKDVAGEFDVILRESEWNGEIHPGADFGCDYHISLGSACLAAAHS